MLKINKTYHWFGDSWVKGAELELSVPAHEVKNCVFPKLVSDYFGANCKNYGIVGSSTDIIPLNFFKIVNTINTDDIVFFCLTGRNRISILDNNGDPYFIKASDTDKKSNLWYKFFDSKHQAIYNYDKTINLLYLWCKELKIKCYFANIFHKEETEIFNLIPDDRWILPKNHFLAQDIVYINDEVLNEVVSNDMPNITLADWDLQKQMIKKYFSPGKSHPNVDGHKKIAELIIEKLTNAENS